MERKVKSAPVKPNVKLEAIRKAVRDVKQKNYLKMDQLKAGYLYKLNARRAGYGIWLPQRQSFATSRIKARQNFLSEESHYDHEGWGATAAPVEEIEKSPFDAKDINVIDYEESGSKYFGYPKYKEILEYLNKFEPREHFFELLSDEEQAEIRASWLKKG